MELENILKKFTGVVDEPQENKLAKLNEQFVEMAKELLYGGYFLVEIKDENEKITHEKKIYLEDIEFYYHEEGERGLKDPIMYHTNDHEGKELRYFELGRLNLHISGVDVTFENERKAYRASFLIRGFRVNDGKYDDCSTHVYDELLFMGVPIGKAIEIKWISEDLPGKNNYAAEGKIRYNVAAEKCFIKNAKNKYEKIPIEEAIVIPLDKEKYYCVSGNVYERCNRKWRFYKNGIVIKKR